MTLPLIYALNHAPWLEKRRIINIIRNESHKPKKVNEVIAFVKDSGGLSYAQQVMERYVQEALVLLHGFADSPHRRSLEQLVQYTIDRSK
jgi:octaprenyl-diphosphate synthase